jgi:5-deoxy-D-glucuronate isomerase
MPQLIRNRTHGNDLQIVPADKTPTDLCSFRLLRPEVGETLTISEPGHELVLVVLSGQDDIVVSEEPFL